MSGARHTPGSNAHSIAAAAAEWVMRRDRGLSPEEQDRYLEWLAADPRHGAAIEENRGVWESFDRLAGLQSTVAAAPDPDLLAPPPLRRRGLPWRRPGLAWAAALAACIAGALLLRPAMRPGAASTDAPALAADVAGLDPIEERTLADGSVLHLNRGATVDVKFTAAERRVTLTRGEASFAVASDPSRPFVVLAEGVTVRAIGTVFNVRRDEHEIDVIVTEGKVALADAARRGDEILPEVAAGQRAIVPLQIEAGSAAVVTPPPEELTRRLAWQPRMLAFTDEPLPVILNEFNRHNPVLLRIDDPALQRLRLTARFRSDNVPGFLRLLVAEFHVVAQRRSSREIVLQSAP